MFQPGSRMFHTPRIGAFWEMYQQIRKNIWTYILTKADVRYRKL